MRVIHFMVERENLGREQGEKERTWLKPSDTRNSVRDKKKLSILNLILIVIVINRYITITYLPLKPCLAACFAIITTRELGPCIISFVHFPLVLFFGGFCMCHFVELDPPPPLSFLISFMTYGFTKYAFLF